MKLRNSRKQAPASFKKSSDSDTLLGSSSTQTLTLKVHLKKGDRSGLEQRLQESSDPAHANFRKHLSKEELEAYVRPREESTVAVNAWLAEHNITAKPVSAAGDILSIEIPVLRANELLEAKYEKFSHESGFTALRTLSYSLPEDLDDHLTLIEPTTDFVVKPLFTDPRKFATNDAANLTAFMNNYVAPGHQQKMRSLGKRLEDVCNEWMTPLCLTDLYGVPTTGGNQQASITVTGFVEEYANEADLAAFLQHLRPDVSNSTTFTTQYMHGGLNPQDGKAGTEASLDIQYTVGVVGSTIPVTFLTVGDSGEKSNGFVDVITSLLQQDTVPQVLSTSYGMNEGDVGQDLAKEMCDQFMQLGARGVSVIFSSGDSGVGSGSCQEFAPTFPSGCPYVTSIGATSGFGPEKAADFSSGGFSNVFDRPSYQADDVSGYISQLDGKYSGLYNSGGRAFPDISASGVNFPVVTNNAWNPVGGTSASTPLIASMIALINDELLTAGKPPLGFLNPWLYANKDAFTDITSGNNPGCGTSGFDALSGWDPATGLGTPLFAKLRTAAGL
ncbi:subtilisin-like protein [Auriculariales sp. MPI-PUGE-AT-0066]|nr:subtilisin-like protein [Auriculariales sp. MPI-PUGE-AT-0066]